MFNFVECRIIVVTRTTRGSHTSAAVSTARHFLFLRNDSEYMMHVNWPLRHRDYDFTALQEPPVSFSDLDPNGQLFLMPDQ